jgi:hypothetical protein
METSICSGQVLLLLIPKERDGEERAQSPWSGYTMTEMKMKVRWASPTMILHE